MTLECNLFFKEASWCILFSLPHECSGIINNCHFFATYISDTISHDHKFKKLEAFEFHVRFRFTPLLMAILLKKITLAVMWNSNIYISLKERKIALNIYSCIPAFQTTHNFSHLLEHDDDQFLQGSIPVIKCFSNVCYFLKESTSNFIHW